MTNYTRSRSIPEFHEKNGTMIYWIQLHYNILCERGKVSEGKGSGVEGIQEGKYCL